MGPLSKIKLMSFVNIDLSFSGLEILIASCSSKIDLGRPGMTFSHYSAEEKVSQKSKVKRELIKAQIT